MKRLLVFILIFLISISIISGLCGEGQVDINSASKGELEDLYLIGPVKAERIFNSRPFDSIDELVEIYGIGEKTLEGIIKQGLACVNEETEKIKEDEEKNEVENYTNPHNDLHTEPKLTYDEEIEKENIELNTIKLNAKSIKTENNKENPDKSNYAKYGFIAFCILLGFLFILKKQKNYKTEFE